MVVAASQSRETEKNLLGFIFGKLNTVKEEKTQIWATISFARKGKRCPLRNGLDIKVMRAQGGVIGEKL